MTFGRALVLVAVLGVAGCVPPIATQPEAGSGSGVEASVSPLPAATRSLQGQVYFSGQPLVGAEVTVLVPSEWRPIQPTGKTDDLGRFQLTIPDLDSRVVQVTAKKGGIELYGTVLLPGLKTLAAPDAVVLDEATTVVTKKLLPKLTEVLISEAPTSQSQDRVTTLLGRFDAISDRVRQILSARDLDQRILVAAQRLDDSPSVEGMEDLANGLVVLSEAGPLFVEAVKETNLAVIDNLIEGGAVLLLQPWSVDQMMVEPPPMSVGGDGRVVIVLNDRVVVVPGGVANSGKKAVEVFIVANRELHNTHVSVSQGGGESGGAAPSLFDVGVNLTEGAAYTGPPSWGP